jgi:hypothetical protein
MLSLKNNNKPLAQIDNSADNTIKKHKKKEKKYIYYKECSPDDEAEIATTPEQKLKIFKSFLSRYKDLKKSEITTFIEYFKSGVEELENRSQNKIYSKGVDFVNNSLKRYLDYGDSMSLFPIINEPSYRMYITALSGSGKSYFCKEWVKHNPPRGKESSVFLFSPVEEDESLKGIKNLIHLKLENYEQEYEKTFELEDLPRGSICIFDDVESYKPEYRKWYYQARDMIMERGRHHDLSCISVSHNPLNGIISKTCIRECQYYVCFPKFNVRDTRKLLETYTGMTKEQIDTLMNLNSRWVFMKKTVPSYFVGQHQIGLL